MIVKPPRSAAAFSPQLRVISVYAADRFEHPEELRPLIPRWVIRRFTVPVLLILAAIALHLGINFWTSRFDSASPHAARADEFRAKAHECEEEARAYRAFAAAGKPGTLTPGGFPLQPRMALQRAKLSDQKAVGFRKLAYIEECKNQGLPVP